MIRNSVKLTTLGAIALLGGAIGVNCSKGSSSGDSGNLKIAFALPGGSDTITAVNYKITATAGGNTLVAGTMNTADANASASLDVALPPTATGATDTVLLTATTTAGLACTTAATTFTVTSGANTNVMLTMICGTGTPSTVPGTVDITTMVTTANSCPSITTAVVAPDSTSVGGSVAVSTTAVDPDGDGLTFAWGPAANFAAPTATSTSYTCTAAGTQAITLAVSDGKGCTANVSLQITCVAVTTTGTGGAAGAGTGGVATGGIQGTGGVATGGIQGTGGVATGGIQGTGGVGTGGSGVNQTACNMCEFTDSASFCGGTTVSGSVSTIGAFGCDGLTGADATNCQNLVQCLRGTACQAAIQSATSDYQEAGSNFDDPHPCLCGNVTLAACLGATSWTGVCAPLYVTAAAADTSGAAAGGVIANFGNSASPIGIANNLMSCDVDSTVTSNGLQNCGTTCGLNTAAPAL